MRWAFLDTNEKFNPVFERPIFIVFHVLAGFAFFFVISHRYAHSKIVRELSSFPFVLLFGILLGIVNMLALLSYHANEFQLSSHWHHHHIWIFQ